MHGNTVNQIKPDVVISFINSGHFYTSLALIGKKIPHICSERNNPKCNPKSLIGKIMRRFAFSRCKRIVFQTQGAKDFFPKKISKKGVIIENPIPDNLIKHSYFEDPYRLIAVGRLEQQKNYPLLIKVMSQLTKIDSNYKLDIFGKGSLETSLKKSIFENGLENNICIKGFTSDVSSEIAYHSIFLLSSDHEGMPNALLEAVAAGVPSVSTDCPFGPREIISRTKSSILVPTNAIDDFVDAILKISNSYNDFCKIALKDSAAISHDLSIERIANKWIFLFNSVIRGGK